MGTGDSQVMDFQICDLLFAIGDLRWLNVELATVNRKSGKSWISSVESRPSEIEALALVNGLAVAGVTHEQKFAF